MKNPHQLSTFFRLFFLPVVASIWLSATAHGQGDFAQFDEGGSTGSEPFTFTNNTTSASFSGTSLGSFIFLVPGAPAGPQDATITLSSSAVTPAGVGGPFLAQPIDGPTNTLSFTRTSDNANLLTLTFTGILFGFNGDNSASLSGDTGSGNTVTYTSDFLDFSGTTERSFGLTATLDPAFTQGAGGFANDFTADLSGGFSSTPGPDIAAVPESSTWIVGALVAGALAMSAHRRHRRTA